MPDEWYSRGGASTVRHHAFYLRVSNDGRCVRGQDDLQLPRAAVCLIYEAEARSKKEGSAENHLEVIEI